MADHTAPANSLFTNPDEYDEELNQYSYPWETEPTVDPLQVAQEELNEWVQSPEDGWHKVHYPGIHKAQGGPFYGGHTDLDDPKLLEVVAPKTDWQALYREKGIST